MNLAGVGELAHATAKDGTSVSRAATATGRYGFPSVYRALPNPARQYKNTVNSARMLCAGPSGGEGDIGQQPPMLPHISAGVGVARAQVADPEHVEPGDEP
jgi:hypothetical protein